MRYDLNSFIAGIMTGMRLSRVPGGKQKPAPSGVYIMSEDDHKIIAEQERNWNGVTIFDTDIWYTLADPVIVYGRTCTEALYRLSIEHSATEEEFDYFQANFFYADLGDRVMDVVVFVDRDPRFEDDYWPDRLKRIHEHVTYKTADGSFSYTKHFAVSLNSTGINDSFDYWFGIGELSYDQPAGVDTWFEGTVAELHAFMANRPYVNLLTE